TFKAVGGIYVAGGVVSRLGPLFDDKAFRAAFEAHPPQEQLLRTIPTFLMHRTEPGPLGCAALPDQLAISDSPPGSISRLRSTAADRASPGRRRHRSAPGR